MTQEGCRSSLLELCESSSFDYKTYCNEMGESLLHIACRLGHLDTVRALIEIYHMPLNIRDKKGNSPCHSACEAGQLRIMDYFDKCPIKLSYHSINFHGNTLLHLACKSGCVPLVRMLICDAHVSDHKLNKYYDKLAGMKFPPLYDSYNFSGHTPIHTACFRDHIDVIKLFFTFLNPSKLQSVIPSLLILADQQNNKGLFSYFLAKERACSFSINCEGNLDICGRHGFQKNNNGSSENNFAIVGSDKYINFDEPALFIFARRGNIDNYIKFCTLFEDADIYRQRNSQGDTILHAVSVSCNVSLVNKVYGTLVPKHFSKDDLITATNCFGFTCLHLACEYGSLELVKFFVHVGFSINEQTKEGHTPIHLSIMHDRKDIFDYLISCDVTTINSKTEVTEETPLHIATCDERRIEYVKSIINHSQFNSANEKDWWGETPLFNACQTGCVDMVDILLNRPICSDVIVVNQNNETVMSIAMRLHNEELLDRLLRHPSIPQYEPEVSLINAVHDCDCSAFEGSHNMAKDKAKASHTCKMIEVLQTKANQYKYNFASDLNCCDSFGRTNLHGACDRGNFDLFKWLLSWPECDCDVKDGNGDTVLHKSIKKKRMDFVQACFPKCNALSRNIMKNTPLHEAIKNRCFDILIYILENLDETLNSYVNGAGDTILHALASMDNVTDIVRSLLDTKVINHQLKNRDGNTPLHIACRSRETLENVELLITLDYGKSSWYNSANESPLLLALRVGIFEEVMDKIPEKYFPTCSIVRVDTISGDYCDGPIEIPVLLFCICKLFGHRLFARYGEVKPDYVRKLIGNPLFRVCDSQGNYVFHYLAMCNYRHDLNDIIDKIFGHYKEYLESFNKLGDSALHIAVSHGHTSNWLIKEILDYGVPRPFVDKTNRKGRIIQQCLQQHRCSGRNLPDIAYYLIAKGANHNRMPSNDYSRGTMPVLHVPVVGDSGVGKSTLINSLKCFTKKVVGVVSEHTPGVVPTEFTYEGLCYQFLDFGGQMEYEPGHAKLLNSLVQSSKSSEQEKSFVFCVMVKATEKIEEIKFQITKWLDFLREKANALESPVRVFLICSHADCIETDEIKQNIMSEVTRFMSKADAIPLKKSKEPIMVNSLMSNNRVLDSCSLRKVVELLGTECSSLLSIPLSSASAVLNCMLNQNGFNSKPYQLKDLVEHVKKHQQFELDRDGNLILTAASKPLLISEVPEVLAEQLEELHIKNYIMLLKPTSERGYSSESCLKKWIIPKLVQRQLLSHACSIFSSSIIQKKSKHLPLTAIAGIVPPSLKELGYCLMNQATLAWKDTCKCWDQFVQEQ